MNRFEMVDSITWLGKFVASHEIGDYLIVELEEVDHNKSSKPPTGKHLFHVFINGEDTSNSLLSLDEALVFAVARKYDGLNTWAHLYFCKGIGMKE